MIECSHSWVRELECGFGHRVIVCQDCDEQVQPLEVAPLAHVDREGTVYVRMRATPKEEQDATQI